MCETSRRRAKLFLVYKWLDDRELSNRVALRNERYDDEWIEDLDDMIRSEGRLFGRQEWDSGGPRGWCLYRCQPMPTD